MASIISLPEPPLACLSLYEHRTSTADYHQTWPQPPRRNASATSMPPLLSWVDSGRIASPPGGEVLGNDPALLLDSQADADADADANSRTKV
jgi:hypothetical protein